MPVTKQASEDARWAVAVAISSGFAVLARGKSVATNFMSAPSKSPKLSFNGWRPIAFVYIMHFIGLESLF